MDIKENSYDREVVFEVGYVMQYRPQISWSGFGCFLFRGNHIIMRKLPCLNVVHLSESISICNEDYSTK